jgi:hypothetical protein
VRRPGGEHANAHDGGFERVHVLDTIVCAAITIAAAAMIGSRRRRPAGHHPVTAALEREINRQPHRRAARDEWEDPSHPSPSLESYAREQPSFNLILVEQLAQPFLNAGRSVFAQEFEHQAVERLHANLKRLMQMSYDLLFDLEHLPPVALRRNHSFIDLRRNHSSIQTTFIRVAPLRSIRSVLPLSASEFDVGSGRP